MEREANASLPMPLDYQESKQLQSIMSRLIPSDEINQDKEAVFIDAYYSIDEGKLVVQNLIFVSSPDFCSQAQAV